MKKIYDVSLKRTQRLTMRVGVYAENEKEAEKLVLAMPKVNRDAGWHGEPASPPTVVETKERPGDIRPGRKGRPSGRWDYPSTA